MRIASWNVNSIKARLENVQEWLATADVDVLCLQELKGESFPTEAFNDMGYIHQVVQGQKAYNGVAIVSRLPVSEPVKGLPGDKTDEQARFVGATINGVRLYCLYLPNGNPLGTEKFTYKLAWMKRLHKLAKAEVKSEMPVVFTGDFNVIPQPVDARYPDRWKNDALFQPESRAAFQALLNLGYTEAYRALHPDTQAFTFWDYTGGALQRNDGIRIDHFLLSPEAADLLAACRIDKTPRGREKASDHTPILIDLAG